MLNIVDSVKNLPTHPWQKGGEYSKNRVLKTCEYLESSGIMQGFFVNSKRKTSKTAEVVCFGVRILTSIIHGLLLNEEDSIKRHKNFLGKRTAGYCKSKKHYRSYNFINLL